jgi:glycosyltransferase involved in cell wall biosynthesis
MKVLYFAQESSGGLLPYAQDQADALGRHGAEVTVLCAPDFQKRHGDAYELLPRLVSSKSATHSNRLVRRLRFANRYLRNASVLASETARGNFDAVLLSSYAEYLAPLWAERFCRLDRQGTLFGAVIQEPVRDFVVGPLWWHKWSVRRAYDYLSLAFTHDEVDLDTCGSKTRPDHYVIPYGPHRFPDATRSREEVRRELDVPIGAPLLFSFGLVRDGKNIDYTIKALREIPEAYFLVAGRRNAAGQKPESYYIELARKLGVENRCRWKFQFISEEEAADLFTASDLVMLTYSSDFRSASAALNVAVRYRRPVVASAGQGSMQSAVRNYKLGIWVEPDNASAACEGIKEWLRNPFEPNWDSYNEKNSWDRNARIVLDAFKEARRVKRVA